MQAEKLMRYTTRGGVRVIRREDALEYPDATASLVEALDSQQGVLLSSSYEFPGRYTRWDVGFVNPPLKITGRGRQLTVEALNERGRVLLSAIETCFERCEAMERLTRVGGVIRCSLRPPRKILFEEERSRQYTVFSLLRELLAFFWNSEDPHFGLYGAFGYELAFQFEPVRESLSRHPQQRDLVLYLPDELVVVDHQKENAIRLRYEYFIGEEGTAGHPRGNRAEPFRLPVRPEAGCDHEPGEYAATVRKAIEHFRRGDLFETVPGQVFKEPCRDTPSAIFKRLRAANPAPYGALMNLGEGEFLVAASPEMYVRVKDGRVETCPISGTIKRGRDALEDAEQVRTLLNSEKDLAELSMCTDVDRNDKARVCEPGSVKVIGRRQVELYSRLIHTVDHVEGRLKPGFDALDAFLSHTWAVTVTGAPKQAAIQFIEDHEKSPRRWYGGAMGFVGFNGNMNTGLTLRTIRIQDGMAEVRAGATLLFDSDPEAEEAETRLKASALLAAIRNEPSPVEARAARNPAAVGKGLRVLMVDHQDSFVHNLAAYFQAEGAEVRTVRPAHVQQALQLISPHLVVLSPGPGSPRDFNLAGSIAAALEAGIPVFGVCLGLQGLVEYFGGSLGQLDVPVHGKSTRLTSFRGSLFEGLDAPLDVGRYHSLMGTVIPDCLEVTARTEDGVVMAIEHRSLPVSAVQFHPESILTMKQDAGSTLIRNLLGRLPDQEERKADSEEAIRLAG